MLVNSYLGKVDEVIDAKGKLVIPELINTHIHFDTSAFKSWHEDAGSRQFYCSTTPEYLSSFLKALTKEDYELFSKYAILEVLKSGTTTITAFETTNRWSSYQERVDVCGSMGIRAYLGKLFSSGKYYTPDGKNIAFEFDDEEGLMYGD